MTLRPYQQDASDAAVEWVRRSIEPCLIEAVTAAGKSHVIADFAARIHAMTGKRILCLAPSAELVTQDREKFLATGNPASMFSASAGAKCLRHPVVFGSPLTVKNRISRFQDGYAAVVLDECHLIAPTVRSIIEAMRAGNPNLRVVGLTATPYRMGDGYIFREWPEGKVNGDDTARNPYFAKCVYRITGPDLIEQGFLTPPVIGETGAEHYDTSGLALNSRGQFDADAVDRAYHGHGRKTAAIVADVVARSRDRMGVMLFAATVRHAEEVLASLPPDMSAMITGETPAADRKSIIACFKDRRIKYLVNVAVLTTGFDAPHVDVIAILRKTESVGLLQQIIGRGLRLHPEKKDCLILDYAGNIETHCPDGDLFAPAVKAGKGGGDSNGMKCICPDCGCENHFTARPDTLEFKTDEAGYCLDLTGAQVMTEWGPMPAHFGRRCWGQVPVGGGRLERCGYRWSGKECKQCGEENDIAARYCTGCKAELVDPGEKLRIEFRAMKKDPTQPQCDEVVSVRFVRGVSQRGAETVRAEWTTPYRKFSTWHMPFAPHSKGRRDWERFAAATANATMQPRTISYVKEASGFYRVLSFNAPHDVDASACQV